MTSNSGKERLNRNCPGVKRLMREAAELSQPTEHYYAAPLEDNLFEWHFTVRGQEGTSFENGIYHGRIIFPIEYPLKPPAVIILTPNGRFEIKKKICLSISEHHPETWQPSWSIRTVLLAIIGFMPTPGKGAIGALDWTDEERKKLAVASLRWGCSGCGAQNAEILLPITNEGALKEETAKYAAELSFTGEKPPSTDARESVPVNPPAARPSNEYSFQPSASEPTNQLFQTTDQPPQTTLQPPQTTATVQPPQTTVQPPQTTVQPPQPSDQQTVQSPQTPIQPTGGFCTLFIMYLLVGLISALFIRRFVRGIYQEFIQSDII